MILIFTFQTLVYIPGQVDVPPNLSLIEYQFVFLSYQQIIPLSFSLSLSLTESSA